MLCSVIVCPITSCYSALNDKTWITQPLFKHFERNSFCLQREVRQLMSVALHQTGRAPVSAHGREQSKSGRSIVWTTLLELNSRSSECKVARPHEQMSEQTTMHQLVSVSKYANSMSVTVRNGYNFWLLGLPSFTALLRLHTNSASATHRQLCFLPHSEKLQVAPKLATRSTFFSR